MKATSKMQHDDYNLAMSKNAAALSGNINKYFQWNLSRFPIEKNKNILDIGCGPGTYFNEIMKYDPLLYYAVDYSDSFLAEAGTLFGGRSNCVAAKLDLLDQKASESFKGYKFDYVLCFDVLEHIKNDRQALMNINGIIKNTGGGFLFLRVPALQAICGENDKAIGHYRRYSRGSFKKLLEECSFEIEAIKYQNIIGIAPWYFVGKILKRSLAASSSEGKFFNLLVPMLKFAEALLSPPLGLSIYCICKVKS